MSNVPDGIQYTKEHEWAKVEGNKVTVGITAFAVEQLGDITLVNLDIKEGAELAAGKAFGTIESVKTLSDLYAPISGKVVAVNKDLDAKPELVNEDCYGKAWMVVIEASDPKFNLEQTRAFLIRLSGRQMKRNTPVTASALLSGLYMLFAMNETLQHYSPEQIAQFVREARAMAP